MRVEYEPTGEGTLTSLANILATRFIQRQDLYAKQLTDGRYVTIHHSLRPDHLLTHLRGELTLGTYLLDAESRGRFDSYTGLDFLPDMPEFGPCAYVDTCPAEPCDASDITADDKGILTSDCFAQRILIGYWYARLDKSAQWLVLRPYLIRAAWWVSATALGYAAVFALGLAFFAQASLEGVSAGPQPVYRDSDGQPLRGGHRL